MPSRPIWQTWVNTAIACQVPAVLDGAPLLGLSISRASRPLRSISGRSRKVAANLQQVEGSTAS